MNISLKRELTFSAHSREISHTGETTHARHLAEALLAALGHLREFLHHIRSLLVLADQLIDLLNRGTGTGGDPVIQLQTAFGGGKTHSLLAVYHIAKQEKPLSSLKGIGAILNNLNIVDLPKSKVVVIDGTNQDASNPRVYGDVHINTLWGDIAWQLGGEEALEEVKKNIQAFMAGTPRNIVN